MNHVHLLRRSALAVALLGSFLATSVQAAAPGVVATRTGPVLQGAKLNGIELQGWSLNGPVLQGRFLNGPGLVLQGRTFNGPGLVFQGHTFNGPGLVIQGHTFNGPGIVVQGLTFNGPGVVLQGFRINGPLLQGKFLNGPGLVLQGESVNAADAAVAAVAAGYGHGEQALRTDSCGPGTGTHAICRADLVAGPVPGHSLLSGLSAAQVDVTLAQR